MSRAPLALISLVAMLPFGARAHDADILYVQAHRSSPTSTEVTETVTLTAPSLALLAPVDVDRDGTLTQLELDARKAAIEAGVWASMPLRAAEAPCQLEESRAVLRSLYVELEGRFRCGPGELSQTFRLLSILPTGYKVILGSVVDGERGQRFATARLQTLTLSAGREVARTATGTAFGQWVSLGVFHIFTGFDHLAFLFALLLVGGSLRRLLVLVTSFTLAHSVTLGLTALGYVPLDEMATRWVEATIAASIIWVAAENLILKTHRHRALLTFGFGLVHGFGFASVLQQYGLGEDVAAGLLGFNLGVELGQAAVVVAIYPLVRLLEARPRLRPWAVRGVSFAVMGAGLFWLVERLTG